MSRNLTAREGLWQFPSVKTLVIQMDHDVLLALQKTRSRPLNTFFILLTRSGTGKAWFVYALIFNLLHRIDIQFVANQISFMNALLAPLLAWIFSTVLKRVFDRERPSHAIEGFKQIIPPPTCGSFPSGHTASSFAFFIALVFVGHPLALLVGIWAILVSFSRLYLGVHYTSDIVGGIFLGFISASVLTKFI